MNLRRFFDVAWERHRIYALRALGAPRPWTDDPIFRDWFFCCVFRRLDKTTEWIADRAIRPSEDHPELWKTILACRYVSKIETLRSLESRGVLCGDQKGMHDLMRHWQRVGAKIFTNAFIVNSHTSEGWTDKVTYLFRLLRDVRDHFLDPDQRIQTMTTGRELFEHLVGLPGVGNFMAYQYVLDFELSERYLARATDQRDWTILGLGAVRGLNRLMGNLPRRNWRGDHLVVARDVLAAWEEEVASRLQEHVSRLAEQFPDAEDAIVQLYDSFLHLRLCDVEHWLCEYDKYMRGGSRKRRFSGGSA